jgi:hypothetical protein
LNLISQGLALSRQENVNFFKQRSALIHVAYTRLEAQGTLRR